jgi:hypothetical protein
MILMSYKILSDPVTMQFYTWLYTVPEVENLFKEHHAKLAMCFLKTCEKYVESSEIMMALIAYILYKSEYISIIYWYQSG